MKLLYVTHHSHNQNRFDVYETLRAGEYHKGMSFETRRVFDILC